jgi:redox-sensitive bicupin YhaK (pirin superfamily)
MEALQQLGRFERGVFYRNEGVAGPRALDSFQAIWEHANQRPMVYPKPQYDAPILMDPRNYRWMPLDGAAGVEEKALGTFTDCAIRAATYKLDPGAAFTAEGRGIYVVLGGTGSVSSETFRRFTTVRLEDGERVTFRAGATAEILLMGLPAIARIRNISAALA